MRISIVGAGAMGSLMAGRLALAASSQAASNSAAGSTGRGPSGIDDLLLYGRPSPHLEAIQRQGLVLVERDGSTRTVPVRASSDPVDVRASDVVLVLVKSWASAESVAPLRSHLTRETVVLTLQNGLGNAAALRSSLLHEGVRPHVWLGVTTHAASRTAPGTVVHTGTGITAIGRRSTEVNPRLRDIAAALTSAGLQTVAVEDIHRWVWRKLAVNAAINPLTALAGVTNAAISRDPTLHAAAESLASEVVSVANASGITIDHQEVLAAVDAVARAAGENRSSMLLDLEAGTRTEIDAINGAVVAEAARYRIKVPANQLMTALVRARERGTAGTFPDRGESSLTSATPDEPDDLGSVIA